jgi:hypothetical protein
MRLFVYCGLLLAAGCGSSEGSAADAGRDAPREPQWISELCDLDEYSGRIAEGSATTAVECGLLTLDDDQDPGAWIRMRGCILEQVAGQHPFRALWQVPTVDGRAGYALIGRSLSDPPGYEVLWLDWYSDPLYVDLDAWRCDGVRQTDCATDGCWFGFKDDGQCRPQRGELCLLGSGCANPAWICSLDRTGKCASDYECVVSGHQGFCEPSGVCSFPDHACPSGRAYRGECVPPRDGGMPDSGTVDAAID